MNTSPGSNGSDACAGSLPPAPDIVRAAYATLIVTSLARARRFWVDLLGFVVTDSDPETLYLRGYDELTHHNLILRAGPEAAAGPLGFRVRSAADLSRAEAYYAALGCRSERLPAGAVRRGGPRARRGRPGRGPAGLPDRLLRLLFSPGTAAAAL
jgi:catechol 2,3-dioxygenase